MSTTTIYLLQSADLSACSSRSFDDTENHAFATEENALNLAREVVLKEFKRDPYAAINDAMCYDNWDAVTANIPSLCIQGLEHVESKEDAQELDFFSMDVTILERVYWQYLLRNDILELSDLYEELCGNSLWIQPTILN